LFDAAREADWTEFLADCGKFEVEIAKEIRIEKFTLAELEEEEQSLERLRRWHRDLTARDVFGSPLATEAAARLKQCVAVCEDYADRVFQHLHETPAGEAKADDESREADAGGGAGKAEAAGAAGEMGVGSGDGG
jgi:hypothetical protein